VAFFLTTPFLGMMYYFLPKAAGRPVYSYRLSIVHFWSLVFIYIWAGPHHLHYTAMPAWASTLGMVFSLMLWMPSWGGMINGLLTLRGAWQKVASDPVLKFFLVGITFYGMSTFEGPMLSIKSVNALSHYTDWTIAHVHAGTLGWNGFMTFGMIYWLARRLFQTGRLWSQKLATTHFWIGTIGILLYVIPIYAAGLTQGLMWRAFDATGSLMYPDFVETVTRLIPFYWVRAVGGTLYLTGMILLVVNVAMTWRGRPGKYERRIVRAAPLRGDYTDPPGPRSQMTANIELGKRLETFIGGRWHRRWERLPMRFTFWVIVAVLTATLFELVPGVIVPAFARVSSLAKEWKEANIPTIATIRPYTPLELAGRDIYLREGCYNCHSQMVRPIYAEVERYGEYSKPGEFIYDHPFQWGSRRIGPDLHRIGGGKRSHDWHVRHLENPRNVIAPLIMPTYAWLLKRDLDFDQIRKRVRVMAMLGVPYGRAVNDAPQMAREQAARIAAELVEQGGCPGMETKEVIALVAYLQRLGIDISRPVESAPEADVPAREGDGTGGEP